MLSTDKDRLPITSTIDASIAAAAAIVAIAAITVAAPRYPSASHLVDHLRRLGEQGCNLSRRGFLSRDSALAAAAAYQSLFGEEDGTVASTYQVRGIHPLVHSHSHSCTCTHAHADALYVFLTNNTPK